MNTTKTYKEVEKLFVLKAGEEKRKEKDNNAETLFGTQM